MVLRVLRGDDFFLEDGEVTMCDEYGDRCDNAVFCLYQGLVWNCQVGLHNTTLRDGVAPKVHRKRRHFVPSRTACTVLIDPVGETSNAYIVSAGGNGYVSRGRFQEYTSAIAKSLCYIADGKVYAPAWAITR